MAASDSHAALMDRIYRRQRFFYDLTRKYYLFGRDTLIDRLELKPGERIIEVGCGTARNLIRIARKYPGAELYGLDASSEMLRSAERSLERAGISGRVKLVQAYAEALTPALFGETRPFDAILFSYSLSMIPDWKQALKSALSALAPGGKVHIVDFGDLKGLGPAIEFALRAWLKLFHVAPREELSRSIALDLGPNDRLTLLPGHYAFLLTCTSEEPKKNALWSVA